MADRENVIVVGGGAAGTSIARQLSTMLNHTKHNLILVSSRDYLIYYPSLIRTLVERDPPIRSILPPDFTNVTPLYSARNGESTNATSPTIDGGEDNKAPRPVYGDEEYLGRGLIPLNHLFDGGHGKLIVGKVASIVDEGAHGGHITLEDGTELTWSVLVLAPGSTWEGPFALPEGPKEDCIDHIRKWRNKFKRARNIVIGGAGAIGIELATEIKDRYPEKDVTLVHGQDLPMNDFYPQKWRKLLHDRIRKLQIKTIYNDGIDELKVEYNAVTTRNGETLLTDLLVPARGGKMNTDFIKTLGENVLWSNGCVRINPVFQMIYNKRIYAAGDVIEWEEQKQYVKALTHADMIARNVIDTIKREDATHIYRGSKETISLTLGEGKGATYFSHLWGLQFGDSFTTSYKARYADVDYARRQLGVED
ncbi:hypothetical protein M378DRAFT_185911 [Amanita muscaria Koide BX008]|uniref:FAD/NAD(P)-binding domain-containing protein n=1 Tax=Amanita muscaria (strain Koide BX008) TaxID=946122 RepID=A0A0C2XDK3_AMAMK|nr:hypothetical protein M378DRAFT_185911 [Amanita muscaria Koide BX008]